MISIGKLTSADRAAWETLFVGYNAFYGRTNSPSWYDESWAEFQEDTRLHALGARLDDQLVGITHFVRHTSTTSADWCYLQDLFTAPEARGKGVARALIAAVTDWARAGDCDRVYWTTQEDNATARLLYDKVARKSEFVIYQIDL